MIYNLQLLRAFAALSVVYLHIVSKAGLDLDVGIGNFGVDVFFVISGFTIAYIGRTSATEFMVRRCVRIIPFYWVATFATFMVGWVLPSTLQRASANIPHLWHSLAFLPYPNKLGLLQPTLALGWTLNYEMYFYVIFAASLVFSLRFAPLIAAAVLTITSTAFHLSESASDAGLFYGNTVVFEFLYGIAAYYGLKQFAALALLERNRTIMKIVLSSVCIMALVALPLQEYFLSGNRAIDAGIPAFFLVFCAIALEANFKAAVAKRWVVILGDSSFVLYLVHPFIVYGAIRLLLNPAHMKIWVLVLSVFVLLAFTALVAICVHLAIEKPLLVFLHRRLSQQDSAV